MPFVLAAPLLVLATAVVALWAHGPLGWVAAVALVAGCVGGTVLLARAVRRWWAGTKAPVRPTSTRVVPGRTPHPG